MFLFVNTDSQKLPTGATPSVQPDLYCVYYLNPSTAEIGDHAYGNNIVVKICIDRSEMVGGGRKP